jgi:2-polyprenyl-6-methoxyphenol hydroxylase-like FAD-dependent oxidoreductase
MKVLIVGGGIGGLALGAFLKQKNIDSDIIERAPSFAVGGYCLGILFNGREMVKKLGKVKEFDEAGRVVGPSAIFTGGLKLLRRHQFELFLEMYQPADTLIPRDALHGILLSACEGIPVQMGMEVTSLEEHDRGVTATFKNGSKGDYDVVVGADGVHSSVRALSFGTVATEYSGWRAYFFWIDDCEMKDDTIQLIEPGKMAAIFKMKDGRNVVVCVVKADHRVFDVVEGRKARLLEHYSGFKIIPDLINKVSDADITPTDLGSIKMKTYTKARITLLGDSAHAFEPFAGMGASMAMEDAYVLADELANISTEDSGAIASALLRYEKRRSLRIAWARSLTNFLALLVRPTSRVFCAVRNFLLTRMPAGFFVRRYQRFFIEKI